MPVTLELGDFIDRLRDADLIDLKWGRKGMLCGNPLPANPKVLTLEVANETDAWIINRAKEAISKGDEDAAYGILLKITDEYRGSRH